MVVAAHADIAVVAVPHSSAVMTGSAFVARALLLIPYISSPELLLASAYCCSAGITPGFESATSK